MRPSSRLQSSPAALAPAWFKSKFWPPKNQSRSLLRSITIACIGLLSLPQFQIVTYYFLLATNPEPLSKLEAYLAANNAINKQISMLEKYHAELQLL